MTTPCASVRNLSGANPPPDRLLQTLSDRWCLPPITPSSSSSGRASRHTSNVDTGSVAEDGAQLHLFLTSLVERRALGTSALTFLGVSKAGIVEILHSLFVARNEDYEDPAELWAIVGEIPEDGYP